MIIINTSIKMVYQVYHAVRLSIIAIDGISSTNDALEFIMAGATGIAVGTANFNNPFAMPEIIDVLERYMTENKIKDFEEIRGIVN